MPYKAGVPWEIAVVLGGLMATVIGVGFAFAALRVKGLYLALSHAGAAVRDGLGDLARAGHQRRRQRHACRRRRWRCWASASNPSSGLYYVALGWCLLVTLFMLNLRRTALGRALVAVREKDYRGRGHRRAELPLQAGGLCHLVLHRRRQRRDADLHASITR